MNFGVLKIVTYTFAVTLVIFFAFVLERCNLGRASQWSTLCCYPQVVQINRLGLPFLDPHLSLSLCVCVCVTLRGLLAWQKPAASRNPSSASHCARPRPQISREGKGKVVLRRERDRSREQDRIRSRMRSESRALRIPRE